jgi:hypothetical protein
LAEGASQGGFRLARRHLLTNLRVKSASTTG